MEAEQILREGRERHHYSTSGLVSPGSDNPQVPWPQSSSHYPIPARLSDLPLPCCFRGISCIAKAGIDLFMPLEICAVDLAA